METPKVETPKEECKPAVKSKTLWLAALAIVAPFLPPVQAAILVQPEVAMAILGGLFGALRVITKGKITLK
jgi:hypothetical protein